MRFPEAARGRRWKGALPWLGLALSIVTFGLDLLLPLGAALGPLYVVAVLTTFGQPYRVTLSMALMVTVLIIVAMLSPDGLAAPTLVSVLNPLVALGATWASVLLLSRADLVRKRLHAARIEADARRAWLVQTMASIGDGVIACDTRARVEFMNGVAEKLAGWTEDQAVGRPIDEVLDLRSELTHQRIENPVHKALRGESGGLEEPALLQCRGGQEWPIDDSAAPIRNDENEITGAVLVFREISERRKGEQMLELRLREVGHRIKNVFANVHSILSLCARSAETPAELVDCVEVRLSSLMRSTERILHASEAGCSLRDIVVDEVGPYLDQGRDRLHFSGTDVLLSSQSSVSLAMIIHELATNASKYGSLSDAHGRVAVDCKKVDDDTVHLSWSETGGPPAMPPERRGMGSKLIDGLVQTQFSGRCVRSYTASGFTCLLELKLGPGT